PVPPAIREEDLKPQSEQGPGLLGKIGLRPMVETPLGVSTIGLNPILPSNPGPCSLCGLRSSSRIAGGTGIC
ncbi:hypothetical protein, partial [Aeromonas hydrophila]|uniref:hypothetical protein n=1 Tax=Aeromonas hydrophila TaxID=644 RepID=UPI001CC419A6